MTEWKRVRWTEARQIFRVLELDPEGWPEAEVSPEDMFSQLRKDGDEVRALDFLGQALPRLEAVAWATGELSRHTKAAPLPALEQQALERALRWVDEPTDEYRRAAYDAAERAQQGSAAQFIGHAVFLSGGSIAPSDLPAVIPPEDVCGRMASAAVLVSCFRLPDSKAAISGALDAGALIAQRGLEALTTA